MKKIKYSLFGLIYVFMLQSCSEDKMDEINNVPDNPIDVESKFIITDVMTATAFRITGSDLSFYAGVYAEVNAGVDFQMYQAQNRIGEPEQASTYNNSWVEAYRQLRALDIIIRKCSDEGEESGNYHTLGIAQILFAYNLAIITDLFGDVPLSEALQPIVILQPKLDKQEDIYVEIFTALNAAIENLNRETLYASLGRQDLIYSGNPTAWVAAAKGLIARYTMRLSYRNPNYEEVIQYVDESFKSNAEEFVLRNAGVPNPFARFNRDREGLATSKSFYDLMVSNGELDVRTEQFFAPLNGVVIVYDNSIRNAPEGKGIYSISGIMSEINPIYLLSYHELLFLKAEAQARLGRDDQALETLKKAVEAAYLKDQFVKFTATEATTYTDTFGTLTGRELLQKIIIEKYISFYENEGIEAYNDVRRLEAMGDGDFIKIVNPQPDKFPQRFGYGLSEILANPNANAVFGDGSYVYSEKVWWAGGNK